ncbi:MAG TPA: 50S ribosomal protein L9 [bacterium]|nr:50S ribosomal protein L9 [bacterium]
MKVLLIQDVKKIGKKGEVLEVKEGYARNFLMPNGLAVEASGGAVKQVADNQKAQEKRQAKEKEEARQLADKLSAVKILIKHKAGGEGHLFGSVTSTEIAEALKQKGFEVDKKKIVLDGAIRLVGTHSAKLKLYHDVTAELSVEVQAL